jgi:haloalkane dehalogenase
MWSFAGDAAMERAGKIAGSALGRFLYRWANLSQRVIMPSAYGDRAKLTSAIHRQYLSVFPDRWSRDAVLWTLARALIGSSAYYERLWSQRERLRELPVLIVWGTRDSAFKPHLLARWRDAVPHAQVTELPVGHWPHEEDPEGVIAAMREFLGRTP